MSFFPSARRAAASVIKARFVLLMGPPGGGKGVISEGITKRFDVTHLSVGEVLRQACQSGAAGVNAERIQATMARGELLPDKLIINMLLEQLQLQQDKLILIDGFPRDRKKQWPLYQQYFPDPDAIIDLSVPRAVLYKRLSQRGRADDIPATINRRLDSYESEILPMARDIKAAFPQVSQTIYAGELTPEQMIQQAIDHLWTLQVLTADLALEPIDEPVSERVMP